MDSDRPVWHPWSEYPDHFGYEYHGEHIVPNVEVSEHAQWYGYEWFLTRDLQPDTPDTDDVALVEVTPMPRWLAFLHRRFGGHA